ncbi:MAG: type II toxin-antitoxin system Phd/YefM family antitoxin [Cyanobacteria bacterium]|uniref:type II toxin-antitoxin system Phd/YefM family antitoxin n=1 Tax=Geminocystis sp. TaxID=2664100 RepID=UPI001DB85E62|nr:type II toxin-antitoxin system Phd/YefM family antitoxin [Cyanobacteria bacterium CG_2015-16_32_12]NCO79568.1 type II toxin-antitoxin system Phd/YefM family antitoxin [Cyanobacteria bacterium CG_2015-22_32_23]NCQ05788.1 type II toxin-antitoxin system Phd/YefM family antitoxin [Cyanobacteria bacterium CG_2015-09_32_10]NCQ40537.1 type II toxin-antitoxin system Phd/YefM family antitoxin [Cyanobacteria bacterium CG_2015-04_32_10]NCS84454.1 type II toxin-antitoxin system Phd/YefM family antitoxin
MKSYTLTETRNQHGEVFDQAQIEPVLVTKQKRASHVIISAQVYQQLITRLEELEDLNLGKTAEIGLTQSSMVGSKEFTATLEKIANRLPL